MTAIALHPPARSWYFATALGRTSSLKPSAGLLHRGTKWPETGNKLTVNLFSAHETGTAAAGGGKLMRVFFHLSNGTEQIRDDDGVEVESLDQAHAQALRALAEFRAEELVAESALADWRLAAQDSSGAVIFTLDLG